MRQWYVVRSKLRRENLVSAILAQSGIETYVPTLAVHREHGKPPRTEPFFPGYLFGHLDPERSEVTQVNYSPGVVGIVGYGKEPWPVPESVVEYIRTRISQQGAGVGRHLQPGDRLVITSGPLRGVEAIFDRQLSATGRVRVLIQLVSQMCPAELHIDQIRRSSRGTVAPSVA